MPEKATAKARNQKSCHSSVKSSRRIPNSTALFLYVHAGGRCEFDGCNDYLLEHYPTEAVGNFAQQAHIFAFRETGPRGDESGRPTDPHSLSNLILLCPKCHHLVDTRPAEYPVVVLKQFKRDHEDRVYSLTGISKDRDTIPLVLKGLVRGRPMDISVEEMQAAVAPNYLKNRGKIEIDLNNVPDSPDDAYWKTTAAIIDMKIGQLQAQKTRADRTLRISVFAIAPIPSLVYLGSKLSDKMDVDLYQRHRDPETWCWKEGPGRAEYITQCLVKGRRGGPVALLVNLSGKNDSATIPAEVGDKRTVYEITLDQQRPTPLFLNTKDDLSRFTIEYVRALATIRENHPSLDVIHLFPAVPAPVAVVLGRSRLPKVDPKLIVYDRDARAGGFVRTMEVS